MRSWIVVVSLALAAATGGARAQTVERPIPFDSAGKVMTVSMPLAARLRLTSPVWPVNGDYLEARLFDRGDGRFVLAVERTNHAVERYDLTSDARAALQREITAAMRTSGQFTTAERQDVMSQPAKGQFVRNQMLAALLVYGPALVALTSDGSAAASGLYLATVGTAFFWTAQLAKTRTITKAQNHMATDGIWRGALLGNAILYVANGSSSGDAAAAATLSGSLAGTMIGFSLGRSMTDGEAAGATFGSTTLGLTTAGLIGIAGGYQHDEARGEIAGIVGGVLAGYPLGLRYVRHASYGVTAGDIRVMSTVQAIGVLGAATPVVTGDPSEQVVAAVLTGGLLAGTLLGDRWFVRHYDYTESEGNLVALGALAGGLVAIGVPLAAQAEGAQLYMGLGALGALAGMALTTSILQPTGGLRPETGAGGREPEPFTRSRESGRGYRTWAFYPVNAAALLARRSTASVLPVFGFRF